MKRISPILWLTLLVAVTFTFATALQPVTARWNDRAQKGGLLKLLLGESRQNIAFFVYRKADIAMHSGYYPSLFDQANNSKPKVVTEHSGTTEAEHEKEFSFLGKPLDWIEAFGRNFGVTEHTHLEGGKEREVLPWLKMSAELDPTRIDTYTVASYFLRVKLGKIQEAEDFLREGLRNNPNSYELLLDLGLLYHENRHDDERARNVLQLALARWSAQNAGRKEQDLFALEQIAVRLAGIEESRGNLQDAIGLLKLAQRGSPHPEAIQAQIDELTKRISAKP